MNKNKKYKISIIISGGQTGADRGGLDFAIKKGLKQAGWCPLNRRAEDLKIPEKYLLTETTTPFYPARTRMNIRDSDATLIFSSDINSKGTLLTTKFCIELKKPYFTVILDKNRLENSENFQLKENHQKIMEWLFKIRPEIVNIAGTRESHCPGIQRVVRELLELIFIPSKKEVEWPPKRPTTPFLF